VKSVQEQNAHILQLEEEIAKLKSNGSTKKDSKLKSSSSEGEAEITQEQDLAPGMYLYSLICDGKLISTKQMIITE